MAAACGLLDAGRGATASVIERIGNAPHIASWRRIAASGKKRVFLAVCWLDCKAMALRTGNGLSTTP